jgi:hypothetical protein
MISPEALDPYNNMIAAGSLQHIGHKLGSNRGSGFVLLVLSRVRETWDYSGDAPCRSRATCIDHDKEFH